MATSTNQQIVIDILEYMKKGGGANFDWYVGISKDATDRLFNGHAVNEKSDWWIYRTAGSSNDARAIESHFIENIKTSGGPGGGDNSANMVYAYKKTAHTKE